MAVVVVIVAEVEVEVEVDNMFVVVVGNIFEIAEDNMSVVAAAEGIFETVVNNMFVGNNPGKKEEENNTFVIDYLE